MELFLLKSMIKEMTLTSNYPHLHGDVPRATSYGVYISQLIRFARAWSFVQDFSDRNRVITEKLLKQGYRYDKLRKTFSKFYYRNLSLISKYKSNLKTLLRQGISHTEFYIDVIYKLRKITGHTLFHFLSIKRIKNSLRRAMIQLYYNVLHVWWSTLLQLAFAWATTGRS